jgi:histidinol-phosphate aminotransferase
MPTDMDRELMAKAAMDTALNRYPDPLAKDLCAAFAALYGVKPELVTAGNGSDELISIILSSFLQKGETVLTLSPDFSMYRFYTEITETPCLTLQKDADLRIEVDQVIRVIHKNNVRLFIFSNPCNPTSVGMDRESVRRILKETDAMIVLDEAYMDFWDQSLLDEVEQYENLIILRTCSKALGMAALRIGFAVANTQLTGILRAAKSPYNVDSVTQAMATIVLSNPTYRSVYTELIFQSRTMLMDGLKALETKGLIERVYESCTNFAYVKVSGAREIFNLLSDHGIIVRCFGDEYLRITAGTESENRDLLASLGFILSSRNKSNSNK